MESIKDGRTGAQDAHSQRHVLPAVWMDCVSLEWTLTQGSNPGHGSAQNHFMDSTKPCRETNIVMGENLLLLTPPVQTVRPTLRGSSFSCSPASSNKPSVQS